MNFKEFVEDDKDLYICDSCKKMVRDSEVKLLDPVDNVLTFPMMISFLYVDKNRKIIGGRKQPTKEKGDKLFSCPYIHLFWI